MATPHQEKGRLHSEKLQKSIEELRALSWWKKRNFVETVELQIGLKNFDPYGERRFSGTTLLQHPCRPNLRFCVIGNQADCDKAKAAGINFKTLDDLKVLNKNKKLIKKMNKQYDVYFASENLIRLIPRVLGPSLSRASKFPRVLSPNANLPELMDEEIRKVKFQIKKVTCLAVPIGTVSLDGNQLEQNIKRAVHFLVSLLRKNWHQIGTIHIKSTMGPSFQIY